MQRIVAIVPARGGSKRVPLKNIKPFLGVPMLTRTIHSLLDSNLFSDIIVSTDSFEIAEIANRSGANEILFRDEKLSGDEVPTISVINDAIERLQLSPEDIVACVYAPNPFLRKESLALGLKALLDTAPGNINYVSSVTTYAFPIQRSLSFNSEGLLSITHSEFMMTHSQDLPEAFHETAQFWWGYASTWSSKTGMQTRVRGVLIPRWLTQDVDTEEDWKQAEIRFKVIEETIKNEDEYERLFKII